MSGGGKMKRTYQPNNRKKQKKLGFFARKKTNILNRRRRKGRKALCKYSTVLNSGFFNIKRSIYEKKIYSKNEGRV